jgi:hypothetical protein
VSGRPLLGPARERNLSVMEVAAHAVLANSTGSVIGSMLLLAATGGTIAICIQLTGRPSSDGGARMSGWGRAVVTVVVTLVVAAVVAGVLTAVGLGVNDEVDATTDLRDTLADSGYTPTEVDCVEARLVHEYGSVDAVEDADDIEPAFMAIVSCNASFGHDPAFAECWADAFVDHFDIDRFDAGALVDTYDDLHEPDDRRFVAIASMTCQGLSQEMATCIYTKVMAADPDMLGDGTVGQTTEQQRVLVAAARECDVG